MWNWRKGSTGITDQRARPQATAAVVAPATAARAEPQDPSASAVRLDPATAPEDYLATEFRRTVTQCRAKFSEPSFDLPTLPASALRVLNLLQDLNVSSRDVARALQLDPVLTARFLRLANSATYGGTQRVDSVQIAIDRLGFVVVKGVVLAISLNNTIIREKRLGQRAAELWRHSIETGVAAQALADRLGLNGPLAFTLGLMHDIGKLPAWIVLSTFPEVLAEVRPGVLATLVEDAHAEMGRVLTEVWTMPADVQLAVGGHHAVSSFADASAYVRQYAPEAEVQPLVKLLGCIVLADRSLAVLGLAQEPGDLTLGDSCLAADMGLAKEMLMDYLSELPTLLNENDFKNL